ncbi:hypothetical protein F5879DRAFT_984764 [Lentinula edodes]|nr:hypothetical protein F5879DRAFT_984764 [Lentinula edodes]
MSFHHSRISSSFKLSFIFVFGLVCAAFAAAMPLSSVTSDELVAVSIPSSNVDATTISERDLTAMRVKVSYSTSTTTQEPLPRAPVSAKLQRSLDVVASELGFIASIWESKRVPHRRNGVVDFVMVVMSKPVKSYTGQMGVTTSTVDIAEEILTTFRLERQDGKSKGRVITLESGAIQVNSPIN